MLSGHPKSSNSRLLSLFRWTLTLAIIALGSYLSFQRTKDWTSELSLWQSAVKVVPRSAKAHHNLGVAFAASDHLEQALSEFYLARSLHPRDHRIALAIVRALWEIGNHTHATLEAEAASRLFSDNARVVYTWAEMLQRAKRDREAADEYRKVKEGAGGMGSICWEEFISVSGNSSQSRK